jgi:hypothetical protein
MQKLNPTTYHSDFDKEPIRVEVGDVKKPKFYPRVKITKWDNEANFSLGLATSKTGTHSISKDGTITYKDGELSARFYNLTNANDVPLKSIRQVENHGQWTALEAAAQYEMFDNIGQPGEMLLATYITTEPAMVAFDNMPVDLHMNVNKQNMVKDYNYPDKSGYNAEDIPMPSFNRLKLVRFLTPYTPVVNPMYMDDGLVQIIVNWHGTDLDQEQVVSTQMDAVEHVMNRHGYPTERHPFRAKLYVRHGDRLVKFFSAQPDKGGLYSYVNLKSNYNKAYDFYKPDVFKDIRDKYAYGLQYVFPKIKDDIVDEMMVEFAKRLKVPIHNQSLSNNESTLWKTLQKLHDNSEWIAKAERLDANWFRPEPKDGLEFEVVLAKKPHTNQIKLTANQSKNVTAYYQAEMSFEEMVKVKVDRPLDVMRSLAVYHVDKRHNQYKTGKITHIYRPVAWDNTGLKVWCDFEELNDLHEGQEYDLSNGLTVNVPQEFLDQAQYPVTVDPTFGYTTAGGTVDNTANEIKGQNVTGVHGTVVDVQVYSGATASDACKAAFFTDSSGLGSFLVGSTELTPGSTGAQWLTFTGFASQTINAVSYDLCFWSSSSSGSYAASLNTILFDANSGFTELYLGDGYQSGSGSTGWPTTVNWNTISTRQLSIYCDYVDIDGSGTMTTGTSSVTAGTTGNTITFTYTAASGGTSSGSVTLVVPSGWSAPSTTGASAGYTTATSTGSIGTLSVASQTITIPSVTLTSGQTITITYGSTASSGPGATATTTSGAQTWQAQEKSTSGGTLTNLASSPSITVNNAADGSGTLTTGTSSVTAGTLAHTITFTYTAATGGTNSGAVTIVVPSGWSAPSLTGANAGYTTASTGSVSVASQTITVSSVTLLAGATLTITYGSTASSGPGATATTTVGAQTWQAQEKSTSGGTLTNLASSPSITVIASPFINNSRNVNQSVNRAAFY